MTPAESLAQTAARRPAGTPPAAPAPAWWLVEVPDGQEPVLRGFPDPLALAAHLAGLAGTPTYAVVFEGGTPWPLAEAAPGFFRPGRPLAYRWDRGKPRAVKTPKGWTAGGPDLETRPG